MARERTSRHPTASPARRRRAARSARATFACGHVPTRRGPDSLAEPDSPADGAIAEPRRSTVLFWGRSSQVPSATTGDGQRSALLGGRAASSHVPAATTGDRQRSARLGGRAAPDSADEQQRRGPFSGGGLNAKRTPGVGARLRGAPRCCPLLLGGRKRGSRPAGHARDIDSRAHGGGGHRGHPAARAATIRGASPPWRLRSRRPRSARKRPRLQRASC